MAQTEGGARRLSWIDLPLPAALLLIGLAGTGPAARNQDLTATPPTYALVVVAALGLLLWRVSPLWSLAVTSTATALYLLAGYPYGPILFTQAISALGATLWLPLRRALIATSAALALILVAALAGSLARTGEWTALALTSLLALPAWLVIPAAVGVAFRSRREATMEVRAARARRAVSEERLRLAQEVHDVAGHGFAVIAMQAGVALRVLDRDPAAARATLEGIRDASRDALAGLRAEVEALRSGESAGSGGRDTEPAGSGGRDTEPAGSGGRDTEPAGSGGRDTAPRRPRSGLADLPPLADRMRASGLPVALELPSSTVEISADVDHAAYRIVQESLTNVLRHAGPGASAVVQVRPRGDTLLVGVRDDGRGAAALPGPGHGIEGMRQRAASVGGTLTAGPMAEGGFMVEASLPLSTSESGT